jgi:hypothetical protein
LRVACKPLEVFVVGCGRALINGIISGILPLLGEVMPREIHQTHVGFTLFCLFVDSLAAYGQTRKKEENE